MKKHLDGRGLLASMLPGIMILFLLLFTSFPLHSQQAISSGGGFFQGGGASLSFTIGESVIATFSQGNAQLTQGFNQPLPPPEIQLLVGANDLACGGDFFFVGVDPGQSSDRQLVIENEGAGSLNIMSFTFGGDAVFNIENGPTPPFSIPPGQQEVLTLRFSPTAEQAYSGTLTISNDDTDESMCVVNLRGSAVIPTMGQWAFFLFGLSVFTLMVVGIYSVKLKVKSVK